MRFVKIKDLYFIRDLYFLSIIALIKVVSWFPSTLPKELVVGTIASIGYRFAEDRRRQCEKRISLAFGEGLSESQRLEVVKGVFYEFWKEAFSLLPSTAERNKLTLVDIKGIEHLQGALTRGCGVILWESRSFGRRNLAKQILYEKGFSIYQVHANVHLGGFFNDRASATWVRNRIIKTFFERCEKQFVEEIIYLPESDSLAFTRRLLGLLKQNAILCVAGDGRRGQKLIRLKFLGQTEFFSTGIISLAKMSGATILPMFCVEGRNGKTTLIIEPPVQIETGGDREEGLEKGMTQYASLLESYIRRHPEMYWGWFYVGELYNRRQHHTRE